MKKAVRAIVLNDSKILVIKRNKFGKVYYTLPGGGVDMGENTEQALVRELSEETSLQTGENQLVFIEQSGEPYGTQYVYLVAYAGGEPQLDPSSDEAIINTLGQNLYEPIWLTLNEFSNVQFVSPSLQQAVMSGIQHGFPEKPIEVVYGRIEI